MSQAWGDSPSMLEVARVYTARGFRVLPIPHGKKAPQLKKWPQLRLALDDLKSHFGDEPQNIGVLLGEPSGWVVDVDIDHPRCLELADSYLPYTPAVFGRPGKPRSHRIFRVTEAVVSRALKSRSAGTLVELRSTGAQTVFPPSTHTSGEPIRWDGHETELPEPAETDPVDLVAALERLANAVRGEVGERQRPQKQEAKTLDKEHVVTNRELSPRERCLAIMRRCGIIDQNDGSRRLFYCACRCVEFDLSDDVGIAVIREYEVEAPFRKRWSDGEIARRLRDAENVCQRGAALAHPKYDADGLIAPGQHDPASGRLILSTERTLPTAEAFVRQFHQHADGLTLRHYAGLLMSWHENRYVEVEDDAMRNRLLPWLHAAVRMSYDSKSEQWLPEDFPANPHTVKAALESIKSHTHLPATVTSPSWLDAGAARPDASEVVPCRSSLLHLPTMRAIPPTPAFFSVNALDYDHEADAPEPSRWRSFLGQLFGDDLQAWSLLEEWFGYCLTGDTSQHKMLLIVGPRRSGKGTIARVLTRLVGASNVAGPTTSSLAGPFGLQPLIGRSLAIVSDARFYGRDVQTVIERLLCISGEDALTIDRKHMTSVTMRLPTRFVFLANELPRLTDASGALAGRFVMLRLTESFYGCEDKTLTAKLLTELPSILNWAIDGWRQLRQRGHFIQPSSVEDSLRDMEDLSSPVGAFVRECCDVGSGLRAWIDDIYGAWKGWCEADGRVSITTKQMFGRDLLAAVPGVSRRCGTNGVRFYQGIGLKGGLP